MLDDQEPIEGVGESGMLEALMRRIRRRRMTTLKPFGEVPADALRVSLGDMNPLVADRLHYHFHDLEAAEVIHGNLLDLDADAIVSPANSCGDMGGGIDKAIDDVHNGEAQRSRRCQAERAQALRSDYRKVHRMHVRVST